MQEDCSSCRKMTIKQSQMPLRWSQLLLEEEVETILDMVDQVRRCRAYWRSSIVHSRSRNIWSCSECKGIHIDHLWVDAHMRALYRRNLTLLPWCNPKKVHMCKFNFITRLVVCWPWLFNPWPRISLTDSNFISKLVLFSSSSSCEHFEGEKRFDCFTDIKVRVVLVVCVKLEFELYVEEMVGLSIILDSEWCI